MKIHKEVPVGSEAPEYTKIELLLNDAPYALWKCSKCTRRYFKQEIRKGTIIAAKLEPRKKIRYNDCCIISFNTYVNTRYRGRISRVVYFEFEPVNNHYWDLDILFPKK